MEEWKLYKFKDITTKIGSGATPSGGKEAYLGGDIALVRSQNVLDLSFSPDGLAYISDEQAQKLSNVELCSNDTLINITGDSVARVCTVPSWVLPARVNQHVAIVRPDKSKVANKYLTYYLLTQKDLLLAISASGATRKALTKGMLENLDILLPSLEYQEKVVNVLNSFDEKIELNNRINHNLEEQAQALYKSWFVDFEPFKDGEFVESELGMIPKGWKVVNLDSLCSIISRGFSPKYSVFTTDIVLGQRCVRNNMIDLSVSRTHVPKNLGVRALCQYDILINSTGMGSLGRVAQIYFKPNRMTYDSHLTLVRSNSSVLEMYLGRNLLSRQDEIENMAVGSTGQTELPRDSVKAMRILLPCDTVLEQFGASLRAIVGRIQCNLEENSDLTTMRDHLLPKLMTGELNINEIDC